MIIILIDFVRLMSKIINNEVWSACAKKKEDGAKKLDTVNSLKFSTFPKFYWGSSFWKLISSMFPHTIKWN